MKRLLLSIVIILIGTYIVYGIATSIGQDNVEASKKALSLMRDLSDILLMLEKELAKEDLMAISTLSENLQKRAVEISYLKPQKNVDLIDEFRILPERLYDLSGELAQAAKAEERANIMGIFNDIRHTCLTCHIKFRDRKPEEGFFPSKGNTIFGEVKVMDKDGEFREDWSNVVAFLDIVESGRPFPLPRKNPVISQKDRQFHPRILPIVRGTTVDFPNDDIIFHNVFSLSRTKPFDLDIYKQGESKSVSFDQTGLVKVYCNIHPQMIANILVLNNPYFAVTDRKGLFAIFDVPDGKYTLRTWYEMGGVYSKEIEVSGASVFNFTFELRETGTSIKHKNKFDKEYRGKYE